MNHILDLLVILGGLALCFYVPRTRTADRIWATLAFIWVACVGLALVAGNALPAHFV